MRRPPTAPVRRLSLSAASLVAFLIGWTGFAPAAAAAPDDRRPRVNPEAPATAYVGGRWYEPTDAGGHFVTGARYSIAGVFTAERPARIDRTIDLRGAWVVPPFGEAHNHNVEGTWTLETAERYLDQGIFYFKNPNDVAAISRSAAHLFNRPEALDAAFSHGGLSIDEGHPEQLYRRLAPRYGLDPEALDGVAFFDLPSPAAAERRWPEVLADEPDWIKLYLLNAARAGDGESGGLAPETFRRAVELAREAGLPTTVHVETAADLELALDAGADEAAHLPGRFFRHELGADGYRISDELARRMAAASFAVVTTTSVTAARTPPPEDLAAIQALQAENLRRLHGAGVPIAVGTDVWSLTALDEAKNLLALGALPAADLLRAWIDTAPRSVFPDRAIGRLAPGYEASFLALECDPTADFGCVERIGLRVKQGVVLGEAEPAPPDADRPAAAPAEGSAPANADGEAGR